MYVIHYFVGGGSFSAFEFLLLALPNVPTLRDGTTVMSRRDGASRLPQAYNSL